jgi:hypothetical protein
LRKRRLRGRPDSPPTKTYRLAAEAITGSTATVTVAIEFARPSEAAAPVAVEVTPEAAAESMVVARHPACASGVRIRRGSS